MTLVYLIVGGAVGTVMRYGVSKLMIRFFGSHFPLGTFCVNLLGCFLIGVFMSMFPLKLQAYENYRFLFVIGFCGAFTTFSTFIYEIFVLYKSHNVVGAITYLSLSLLGGLAALIIGLTLSK